MRSLLTRVPAILGLILACTLAPWARAYEVITLASGLDKPWSIADMGGGAFLVTEKTGRQKSASTALILTEIQRRDMTRRDHQENWLTRIGGTPAALRSFQGAFPPWYDF